MHAELMKWYIILLIVAFIIYSIMETKAKEVKPYRRVNLLYAGVVALTIGIVPIVWYLGFKESTMWYFVTVQFLILIIGILHTIFLYKILPWTSPFSFICEFLFSLTIICLGSIFLLISFSYLHITDRYFLMLSALVWIFVPFLFMQAFNSYVAIPGKIFKKWVFPLHQAIAPPSDNEMESPVVITFEFSKTQSDNEKTIFRAKAPLHMSLGRLFYYFINDYNDSHPDTPVEISSHENAAYGWLFFKKGKWYRKSQYLDFEETIENNKIRENSVIECHRVNQS
ncbi:hypothetical protein E9993_19970 [Labilibacter sediminis]|nr:hypothetical protein E9993_19970 [Labilibacter sediminis]